MLVNTIKIKGMLLNVVYFQVHKNIKESDGFHNHSTQLTMIKSTKLDYIQ